MCVEEFQRKFAKNVCKFQAKMVEFLVKIQRNVD